MVPSFEVEGSEVAGATQGSKVEVEIELLDKIGIVKLEVEEGLETGWKRGGSGEGEDSSFRILSKETRLLLNPNALLLLK